MDFENLFGFKMKFLIRLNLFIGSTSLNKIIADLKFEEISRTDDCFYETEMI